MSTQSDSQVTDQSPQSSARSSMASTPQTVSHASSTSPSAPSTRAPGKRPGIKERRADGEPRVYGECPSYPKFDQPIPRDATLEEICRSYPNHIRGSFLYAFLQWHWTGTDICNLLSDKAKEEFRQSSVSTFKEAKNRANFLGKRIEDRLRALDTEDVVGLCTAPKIRGAMMDGRDVYGKCKMAGKFNNPYAAPVRSYPGRKERASGNRRNTAATNTVIGSRVSKSYKSPNVSRSRVSKSKASRTSVLKSKILKTIVQGAEEFVLWESTEQFETYTNAMAEHWGNSVRLAETILNCDALLFDAGDQHRRRLVVEMIGWPAQANADILFDCESDVQECDIFKTIVSDRVKKIVVDLMSSSSLGGEDEGEGEGQADDHQVIISGRNHREKLAVAREQAIDRVLAEETSKFSILQTHAEVAKKSFDTFGTRGVEGALALIAQVSGVSKVQAPLDVLVFSMSLNDEGGRPSTSPGPGQVVDDEMDDSDVESNQDETDAASPVVASQQVSPNAVDLPDEDVIPTIETTPDATTTPLDAEARRLLESDFTVDRPTPTIGADDTLDNQNISTTRAVSPFAGYIFGVGFDPLQQQNGGGGGGINNLSFNSGNTMNAYQPFGGLSGNNMSFNPGNNMNVNANNLFSFEGFNGNNMNANQPFSFGGYDSSIAYANFPFSSGGFNGNNTNLNPGNNLFPTSQRAAGGFFTGNNNMSPNTGLFGNRYSLFGPADGIDMNARAPDNLFRNNPFISTSQPTPGVTGSNVEVNSGNNLNAYQPAPGFTGNNSNVSQLFGSHSNNLNASQPASAFAGNSSNASQPFGGFSGNNMNTYQPASGFAGNNFNGYQPAPSFTGGNNLNAYQPFGDLSGNSVSVNNPGNIMNESESVPAPARNNISDSPDHNNNMDESEILSDLDDDLMSINRSIPGLTGNNLSNSSGSIMDQFQLRPDDYQINVHETVPGLPSDNMSDSPGGNDNDIMDESQPLPLPDVHDPVINADQSVAGHTDNDRSDNSGNNENEPDSSPDLDDAVMSAYQSIPSLTANNNMEAPEPAPTPDFTGAVINAYQSASGPTGNDLNIMYEPQPLPAGLITGAGTDSIPATEPQQPEELMPTISTSTAVDFDPTPCNPDEDYMSGLHQIMDEAFYQDQDDDDDDSGDDIE